MLVFWASWQSLLQPILASWDMDGGPHSVNNLKVIR